MAITMRGGLLSPFEAACLTSIDAKTLSRLTEQHVIQTTTGRAAK